MVKATPPVATRRARSRARPGGRRAWFTGALLGVAALALGLRLVIGAQLFASFPPTQHFNAATDMFTYDALARQILAGTYFQIHDDHHDGFYYQPLYYAVFLPLVYLLTHGSVLAVMVAQSLLGAATVWLVGWSFARLGGRACGLLAAALLALSRMTIFYTAVLQVEILQAFWLALWLALALWAYARRARWRAALTGWAACGLVAGLATLTRGNMVLLLPVPLAVVAWTYRRQLRRALASVALVLVLWYLPQLPFALVNDHRLGRWVGPSSAGGAVLALGNTPEAPPGGRDPGSGAGAMDYPLAWHQWMQQDAADGVPRVSVAANMARWIAREPLAWLELKWRILLLFWDQAEIPNNVALPAPGQPGGSTWLRLPLLLDFNLIGGLGLAGLGLALWRRRRHPGWWLAGGLTALYCLSMVLFYMLERFRLPAYPLICGCGAFLVTTLIRRYRTRKGRGTLRLLTGLLACLAGMLLVAFGADGYRQYLEATVLRVVRPQGVALDLAGVVLAQDHGPLPFGGWEPVNLTDLPLVEKQVRLPRGRPATCRTAQWHLYFANDAPRGTPPAQVTVTVWCAERQVGTATFAIRPQDGLQEVDVPLDPALLPLGQDVWSLRCDWHSDQATVVTFLDQQRQYGRTTVGGRVQPGELVASLRLWK